MVPFLSGWEHWVVGILGGGGSRAPKPKNGVDVQYFFFGASDWVMVFKELRSLPPSSVSTRSVKLLDLSIPIVPLPVLLPTSIKSLFQAYTTTLIPTNFFFFCSRVIIQHIQYQSGSFPWYVEMVFTAPLCQFLFGAEPPRA